MQILAQYDSIAEMAAASTWTGCAAAGVAVALGLVLWLRGRGLMRCLAAIIGASVLGITCAALIVTMTARHGEAMFHPWQGLLVGCAIGGVAGAMSYRWMLTIACGLVTCLIAAGGAWMWAGARTPSPRTDNAAATVRFESTRSDSTRSSAKSASDTRASQNDGRIDLDAAAMRALTNSATGGAPDTDDIVAQAKSIFGGANIDGAPAFGEPQTITMTEALTLLRGSNAAKESRATAAQPDPLAPVIARVRQLVGPVLERGRATWSGMSSATRATMITAGAIGLAVGVLLATYATGVAATIISSLLGAAAWMAGLAWLSCAMQAPWRSLTERPTADWAMAWLLAAAIGVLVQGWWTWSGRAETGTRPTPRTA